MAFLPTVQTITSFSTIIKHGSPTSPKQCRHVVVRLSDDVMWLWRSATCITTACPGTNCSSPLVECMRAVNLSHTTPHHIHHTPNHIITSYQYYIILSLLLNHIITTIITLHRIIVTSCELCSHNMLPVSISTVTVTVKAVEAHRPVRRRLWPNLLSWKVFPMRVETREDTS
jgi:hypothetical protein